MERHHKEKRRDKLSKKEQDRQAIIKFIVGIVLMMALLSFNAGILNLGIPFIIGLSLMPNGRTLKDKWNRMGKKQKGIFILVAIILTPFIIVGLMWTMLIASMILIDMLVFVPIFLIVAWFMFRKPKYQKNAVTKFLGSYYSLAIGVILLMVIIGLASYNYYTYEKSLEYKNLNWSDVMTSLQQPDSHGYVHVSEPIVLPNGTVNSNFRINPSRTHDVRFLITDVITPRWLNNIKTNNIQEYLIYNRTFKKTNMTNESSIENNTDYTNHTVVVSKTFEKIEITGKGMPIANARVLLVGKAKPNNPFGISAGNLVDLPQQYGLITADDGLVEFKNVSEGVYELKVYADGYYTFAHTFVVCNATTNGTFYTVPMIPIYFHINVVWSLKETTVSPQSWMDGFNAVTFAEEMKSSNITILPSLVPTKEEVNHAFGLNDTDTQMFWSQLRRENSMYGWLGVGTPNSPINDLALHMMFNQQILYTQAMYLTTHDINPEHGFGWNWQTALTVAVIVVGVVGAPFTGGASLVLAVGGVAGIYITEWATQKHYYVKVDYIIMTTKIETTGSTEEPIIWTNNGGKVESYNINSLAINYTPNELSHLQVGNKWNYNFDFYVFGKGYPMSGTINLQVTLFVVYHYVDQYGNIVSYNGHETFSYASTQQAKIIIPTYMVTR